MKNLFNNISQDEKDRILQMHKPKKVFLEQKQIKELPPVSLTKLTTSSPTNNTEVTNLNILKSLNNEIPEIGKLNLDVKDKGFLSKVSEILINKGITPYLHVDGQSVSPGVSFIIPKLGVNVEMDPGHFGISKELPFLNHATLSASLDSSQTSNSYNIGLKIPIGK